MEVYEVKWKELAKFMTRQLFVILSFGFIVLMLVRLVSTGFDMAVTFEHIKLSHVPVVFFIIFVFSLTFAFLISALLKCARVTIENGVITGRNYWLFKRSFELVSIKKAFPFNSNGMPVVIVDAGKKGEIHIPVHIEKSEELFALLDNYQNGT
ncbi:hypothetical protein KJY73_12850 [Bowmanella sp. Y26]|uniref:hypothetical protein n=1 Tax=Bowmanella yangjiangensis TaxID=2811230 RepID=UPI001BDBE3CE|nr:hypothetical protein [Bowmanella yangjiangensis]MBT1064470.1 hypothetical protein [Bowmanella yangjiangensis]